MSEELRLTEEEQELLWTTARAADTDPHKLLVLLLRDLRDFWTRDPESAQPGGFVRLLDRLSGREDLQTPVRSTPNVMGGDACLRSTRIPVWSLVAYKQGGFTDARLLANFPGLSAADLVAAWDYYAANTDQVEAQRRRHEEAE